MLIRLPCGCCCQLAKESFNHPDESFQFPPTKYGFNAFKGHNSNRWEIKDNVLQIRTGDGNDYTNVGTVGLNPYSYVNYASFGPTLTPSNLSCKLKFALPATGKWQLRFSMETGEGTCGRFAVEIEAVGSCWAMRLFKFDIDDFTGQEQIGDVHDVPLDGLVPDTLYQIRLCIDPQKRMVRAVVIDDTGREQWHHAKNIELQCCPREVFIMWAVDASVDGAYKFDDFDLSEIKVRGGSYGTYDGETYHTCYAYYNKCPDCLRLNDGKCEEVEGISGSVEVDDCRWHTISGGRCYSGSSSGVDSNGEPDNTTMVEMSIHIPPGGTTATTDVSIGGTSLTFAIDGDGNWTNDLSTGETDSGATAGLLDTDVTLRICCLPNVIVASVISNETPAIIRSILHHVGETDCSGEACGHAEEINDLRVVHHLLEKSSCFRCLETHEDVLCGDCTLPQGKTVTWTGGDDPPPPATIGEYDYTWQCGPFSWGMIPDPDNPCTYINGLPYETWPDDDCFGSVTYFPHDAFGVAPWMFAEVDWMCAAAQARPSPPGILWNYNDDPFPDVPVTPYLQVIEESMAHLDFIRTQIESPVFHTISAWGRSYIVPYSLSFIFGQFIGFEIYDMTLRVSLWTAGVALLQLWVTRPNVGAPIGYQLAYDDPSGISGCEIYTRDMHIDHKTSGNDVIGHCDAKNATGEVIG